MKTPSSLHFNTSSSILLILIFGPLGNLLLGKGMKGRGDIAAGTPAELARFVTFVLRSEIIWLGIGSLMVFFVAYTLLLSGADYSYVHPTWPFAYARSPPTVPL